MGIRWRDGLNVFNMGKVIKLPKKVVHKGHVGLSMERWKKDCGASAGKWIKSQRRLCKGSDGHSMEGWTECF